MRNVWTTFGAYEFPHLKTSGVDPSTKFNVYPQSLLEMKHEDGQVFPLCVHFMYFVERTLWIMESKSEVAKLDSYIHFHRVTN
jgi:hypothetical protein